VRLDDAAAASPHQAGTQPERPINEERHRPRPWRTVAVECTADQAPKDARRLGRSRPPSVRIFNRRLTETRARDSGAAGGRVSSGVGCNAGNLRRLCTCARRTGSSKRNCETPISPPVVKGRDLLRPVVESRRPATQTIRAAPRAQRLRLDSRRSRRRPQARATTSSRWPARCLMALSAFELLGRCVVARSAAPAIPRPRCEQILRVVVDGQVRSYRTRRICR
jgi:hypothetical protein